MTWGRSIGASLNCGNVGWEHPREIWKFGLPVVFLGGEAENFDFENLASLAKFEKFTAYANMELLILLVSFHFHAHALSPRILVLPPPLPYVGKIIAAASLWCMFSDMILDS